MEFLRDELRKQSGASIQLEGVFLALTADGKRNLV
jgi:hypothetical protein